jgi:ABC-type sugar transport system, periplasmic component
MKKKMLAFLLAATMAGSLMGCGSNKGSDVKDSSPEAESGKAQAADPVADETDVTNSGSEDDNTLTIWGWDPSFTFVSLEEAARVYQEINPDFKLNLVEMTWDDVQAKITTSASAGELGTLPDVLLLQDNAYQKNVMSYPELFEDLTDCGVNFDEFSPGKISFSTIDDRHYGIPFDNGTSVACYRTDILEEAGFTIDDFTDITWSQYIENGKKVLEATGKPLMATPSKSADLLLEMMRSAGASMFNEEGIVNLDNNEVINEAATFYKEMLDTGILRAVNDWNGYIESFTRGDVAGTINGCWILASVQIAEDQSGKWAITNIPRLEKAPNATNYTNNGGSTWGVNAASPKKELATDFLKNTFAGSKEMYDNILPATGCLSTWLPAGDTDVYAQPVEFYAGDAIYQKIVDYAGKVPTSVNGKYYYEAADALATALSNIENGGDIASELKTAQETAVFSTSE